MILVIFFLSFKCNVFQIIFNIFFFLFEQNLSLVRHILNVLAEPLKIITLHAHFRLKFPIVFDLLSRIYNKNNGSNNLRKFRKILRYIVLLYIQKNSRRVCSHFKKIEIKPTQKFLNEIFSAWKYQLKSYCITQ